VIVNLIRSLMSVFLLSVIAVSIAGWFWTSSLPESSMVGARVVLVLSAVMAAGCLIVLWREKEAPVN
jgi:hypothetical protein